eukprot:403356385
MAQSTNSNQFMSGIKKRMPPSQALYSIQDQLEDLRHKEVQLQLQYHNNFAISQLNALTFQLSHLYFQFIKTFSGMQLDLEKAKLDFFKKAEEHRFQQDLQQAKKDHEEQILLIKSQNENNSKLLSQQHQKEVNMLISSQRLEMERVREANQEYVSELLNRIDFLEGELKRRTKDLQDTVQELQQQLHQQYDEQLAAQKLKISRKFKNQRDQQVKEVVEKMQEETFSEINKLQECNKELERENLRLYKEVKELNKQNKRQEEFIKLIQSRQQSAAENRDQNQNQQQTVIVVQQKEESNELMIVKLDNQAQTEFEVHSISLQTDPVQDNKDLQIQELRQQLNDLQQQLAIHQQEKCTLSQQLKDCQQQLHQIQQSHQNTLQQIQQQSQQIIKQAFEQIKQLKQACFQRDEKYQEVVQMLNMLAAVDKTNQYGSKNGNYEKHMSDDIKQICEDKDENSKDNIVDDQYANDQFCDELD